jgi:hypothetical protein
MKNFTFTIVGTSAMIVHNGGNISPLHPLNKLKAEFTGKRKKTDGDHRNIARIEWFQSLYLTGFFALSPNSNGDFYIEDDSALQVELPIKCVRACIKSGAKLSKNGKNTDRAILYNSVDFFRPSADGKKLSFPSVNKMSDMPEYIDESVQSVNRAKVMRYRGRFQQWGATVNGILMEEIMNPEAFKMAIEAAGSYEGINDSRSLGKGRFVLADFVCE